MRFSAVIPLTLVALHQTAIGGRLQLGSLAEAKEIAGRSMTGTAAGSVTMQHSEVNPSVAWDCKVSAKERLRFVSGYLAVKSTPAVSCDRS